MIINLIIIVFVIAMAVMWSTYGLFSALLHLLVVIASGALAFAFWEIFVSNVFIGFLPAYAWGVGLVLPFAVFLIVLRQALDNLIGGNMQFPRLVNQIVGAAVGACSGILTAGITLIGISFLPLPSNIAGWAPFEVNTVGEVVPTAEGGKLWLKVDSMTANFYNRLSVGAFGTSTPLAYYQPDIAKAAVVHRLAKWYDPNQSLVISPDTVSIKEEGLALFTDDRVPGIGTEANAYLEGRRNVAAGDKLVMIQTTWTKGDGAATYDSDSILRVPPTQVRLLVDSGQGPWESVAPIGFSRPDPNGVMQFYAINNSSIFASAAGKPSLDINWVFSLGDRDKPAYAMLRNTRFELPEAKLLDGGDFGPLVGALADPSSVNVGAATPAPKGSTAITTDPVGYATHKIVAIESTSALPAKVSKNKAQGLTYSKEDGDAEVLGGNTVVGSGAGGRGNSVDRVAVNESLSALRAQITKFTPTSIGAAQSTVQPIRLVTVSGDEYFPFAYVLKMSDGRQRIRVEKTDALTSNTDLPLNEMKDGDELYVYWRLERGVTIESYQIGNAIQSIDYTAP
ncbi:CvpA family protein [Algisphaera agarilytica]|uniref:Colicin V production protein n=1 Tax=Algisphaera agarilytica TaxID=1385975 RepID=A0A7X0LKT4_9BACT|nr:CvpA family protein [Algisphaera agarilytica]MBB6429273.1 hypothetical protein [Algisphaera agarilytica]